MFALPAPRVDREAPSLTLTKDSAADGGGPFFTRSPKKLQSKRGLSDGGALESSKQHAAKKACRGSVSAVCVNSQVHAGHAVDCCVVAYKESTSEWEGHVISIDHQAGVTFLVSLNSLHTPHLWEPIKQLVTVHTVPAFDRGAPS